MLSKVVGLQFCNLVRSPFLKSKDMMPRRCVRGSCPWSRSRSVHVQEFAKNVCKSKSIVHRVQGICCFPLSLVLFVVRVL